MKEQLIKALNEGLKGLEKKYRTDLSSLKIDLTENKEKSFGDYSSNLALVASKQLSVDPKKIAEKLGYDLVDHKLELYGRKKNS